MGWAAEDFEIREQLKAKVGLVRMQIYELKTLIDRIKHEEKRSPMIEFALHAYSDLDQIDFTLNR